jgi:erythromycin esterase-like protein
MPNTRTEVLFETRDVFAINRSRLFRQTSRIVATLFAIAAAAALHSSFAQGKERQSSRRGSMAVERVVESVCRKQVVALGQLGNHGEAKGFQAKAEIVRRLVERCGFDAVLFEAPIYDFLGFEASVAGGTATDAQLDRSIGRFWLTRELAEWRRWLFERASKRKLIVGGVDDQVSITSDYARATLPGLVEASIRAGGPKGCGEIVERHLYWRYNASKPFDESEQQKLYNCTRSAADGAEISTRMARAPSPEQRMLASLAGYAGRQRGIKAAPERDHAMYINYEWYAARRPMARKVIIWTATVHAARRQGSLTMRPLGAWLAERHGNRFAAIGFTAFSGMSSQAGGPPKPLEKAPTGSLEARFAQVDEWTFLNSQKLRKIGKVSARLFDKSIDADWSTYFDGVMVVRDEVAPTFDPW